jgi:hypothetical protein
MNLDCSPQLLTHHDYPYPYGQALPKDFLGRKLPPLPSQKPPLPSSVYHVNRTMTLRRPTGGPRAMQSVSVKIARSIDVGYNRSTQSVLVDVEVGPPSLVGKRLFMKVYDPLYVDLDDLGTVSINFFTTC